MENDTNNATPSYRKLTEWVQPHRLKQSLALESIEKSRKLYLAVPLDVYQTFFQYEFTQSAVQRYQVFLIVYDPTNEVIVQWTK